MQSAEGTERWPNHLHGKTCKKAHQFRREFVEALRECPLREQFDVWNGSSALHLVCALQGFAGS